MGRKYRDVECEDPGWRQQRTTDQAERRGTPGENGAPNGDLWLVIRIAPHPLFDIVNHDLEIVVPLAPWEAALGAKVAVPTLKEHILLTIPPGSGQASGCVSKAKD